MRTPINPKRKGYLPAPKKMAYMGMSQHIDFDNLPDPNTRFELLEVIGEGTYGEVFAAKDHDTGQSVAIKIMENIGENLEEIEEEYLILKDLSLHPNLPAFHGIFLKKGPKMEEDQAWIVMELCPRGSVTDLVQALIRRGQRLTEEQIGYILKETIDAMVYLHENHCMHRDIKGHNILLTNHGAIKLVDFGVSSHLSSTWGRRNTSVGTPYWMAPEVIACEQQLDYSYDVRCDVWSLGITALELADGEPPLSEIHPMRALFQIPRNPPPQLDRPVEWSLQFNDFISECLVKDFEQRPIAKELLHHPFIKNVPHNPEEIRRGLVLLQNDLRKHNQLIHKDPEATIKGGALKADRKTKRTPLWMDDLACLEKLSEEVIVDHLFRRYKTGQIYTYMGDILIAVNPFKELGVYGDKESHLYRGMVKSENPPHIFAMADNSYHNMLHHKMPQCIVISGESGAGKTESANFLLKHLVTLGKAPNRNLEDKILQVNPIMEAFGNAKTGINDNSSRFGKYLELTYTRQGKITGAKISVYLLEQSRVVHHQQGEQSFHIFYYLHDGLEDENKLMQYCLDKNKRDKHRYLSGTNWSKTGSEYNVQQFQKVVEGLKSIGFKDDELDSVYRILAAVINLGDVDFYQTIDKDNMEQAAVKNVEQIKIVSELLGIDPSDLTEALTSNSVVTKGEIITRNNTVEEANSTRDAMAKAMYGRLFDWIVNNINRLLSFCRMVYGDHLAVGLLDIFGFENFENNSFEQLCINIANEQIQYFFNQHIFTWEQQEYMSEGIEVDIVEFADNRPVLDMFLAKPMGLLALLDEESRFPKATDQSLVDKFHNNVKSQFYLKPKAQGLDFGIRHFAGKVNYDASKFLEKNKNFLPTEVIQLFRQSSHDVIRFLFQCPLTKTGNLYYATPRSSPRSTLSKQASSKLGGSTKTQYDSRGLASQTKAQQTVATYFRYSLMDLLQKMVNGTPHFIRCIKPNDEKQADNFDMKKVQRQLRYAGVMETVRIRQHGFSHRILFADFLRRYCFLAFNFDERVTASRENCRLLLLRLKMDGWALGKTKVFLKYYHVEFLAKMYEKQIRRIIQVQACVRRWLAKIRYQKEKWALARSVITLQRYARGWIIRKKYQESLTNQKNAAPKKGPAPPPPSERKLVHKDSAQWMKAKMMGALGAQSSVDQDDKEEKPKKEAPKKKTSKTGAPKKTVKKHEDLSEEEAAIIIQSYVRGHNARREWGPVLEERLSKLVEKHIDNAEEASKALQAEGLTPDEAAMIIQKFWGKHKKKKAVQPAPKSEKPKPMGKYTNSKRMTSLIMFSQSIHMSNQEVHKYLRRQKAGIRMEELKSASKDYKRPKGFDQIPQVIHEQRKRGAPQPVITAPTVSAYTYFYKMHYPFTKLLHFSKMISLQKLCLISEPGSRPVIKITSTDEKVSEYYDFLQEEMRSPTPDFNPDTPWDAPLASKMHHSSRQRSQGNQPADVNLRQEKLSKVKDGLKTQNMVNMEQSDSNIKQWKGAVVGSTGVLPPELNRGRVQSTTNMQAASDLRQMLRSTDRRQAPQPHAEGRKTPVDNAQDDPGPFNFRQMLRKTNYAPTDTIRKRQLKRDGVNGYGAEYQM
ncbi:myosin-IIIb-like isoform X3 [Macrobrachium nipponense]|uniref:myosin-IIIb-like isoform X3 n=1 Tax=Macrobrachium nipponense TaxID=159736 RepID=UPI0030C7F74E